MCSEYCEFPTGNKLAHVEKKKLKKRETFSAKLFRKKWTVIVNHKQQVVFGIYSVQSKGEKNTKCHRKKEN